MIHSQSAATCVLYSAMPGSAGSSSYGSGSGTSWSDSGGDGVDAHVEHPDVVTPVARETLLGTWAVSSSGIW